MTPCCASHWNQEAQRAAALPDIQTSHPGTCGWWALCRVWPCEGTCSDRGASAQRDVRQTIRWCHEMHHRTEQCWINCRHPRKQVHNGFKVNLESVLTGLIVFSSWIPYFSMLRWASANFTKASLAAAWGSRTPMTENTSPNAGGVDFRIQTLKLR